MYHVGHQVVENHKKTLLNSQQVDDTITAIIILAVANAMTCIIACQVCWNRRQRNKVYFCRAPQTIQYLMYRIAQTVSCGHVGREMEYLQWHLMFI